MQPEGMFAPTPVLRAQDCSVYANHAVAHGENQRLQPRVRPELCEDARHVVALRPEAYIESLGDSVAVQTLGEQLQDLPFSGSKACDGLPSLVGFVLAGTRETEQLHDLLQGQQRFARAEPLHGFDYLLQLGRLVQDPRGPVLDRPGYLGATEFGGQHKRLRPPVGGAKLLYEVPAVAVRQDQVDHRHVWRLL